MNALTIQTLRTAIADSVANATVPTVSIPDVQAAIAWIERTFADVDWDSFPDRIVIFGDDSSVDCGPDGDGAHFVLTLTR